MAAHFLSAQGGKLQAPLCLPPGLSQEDMMRTKEITEEKKESEQKKEQR